MHLRTVLTRAAVVMPGLVAVAVVTATPAAAAATAPPGYRIVRAADIAAPPSIFNATGQASCPTGTVPLDEDRHGWFGEAVNQQPGMPMLTGQAICAA